MKTTVQEDMFADVHISKLKRAKSIVNTVTSPLCSSTVTAASASWFINSLFCLFNAHTVSRKSTSSSRRNGEGRGSNQHQKLHPPSRVRIWTPKSNKTPNLNGNQQIAKKSKQCTHSVMITREVTLARVIVAPRNPPCRLLQALAHRRRRVLQRPLPVRDGSG